MNDYSSRRSISPNIPSPHSLQNKLFRCIWGFVWLFLFRLSPKIFHGWRCFLLRLFGAKIGKGVCVYPSVKIWLPKNLKMADNSCLAAHVDCYNVEKITIGENSTVTQYSYLCTTTHDITHIEMPLITGPIIVEEQVWVGADVYIGLGVRIGQGAVVGARSSVYKNVAPWTVVGGNPAVFLKERKIL
jgi:putative colanic acid biosynthesis acetyltransferase WcaF